MNNRKILMIGFDAADLSLIREFIKIGELPCFGQLIKKNSLIELESTAEWLAGSPWPSFYTGKSPGEHGIFHSNQWNPDLMKRKKISNDWLNPKPFWRDMSKNGVKVVAIDVPMVFSIEPLNGVEITSWVSHDRVMSASSYPHHLMKAIVKDYGPPRSLEEWGPSNLSSLLKHKENMIFAINQGKKISIKLIEEINWNLFIMVFGSTHSAGHSLFDSSSVWGRKDDDLLFDALLQVYKESDKALEEILKKTSKSTLFMVFSLHGMTKNTSKNPLLSSMLKRIIKRDSINIEKNRMLDLIPLQWRYNISRNLPNFISSKFDENKRINNVKNWENIKAFCIDADHQGYIRINLKGREKEGTVKDYEEYKKLLDKISSGLKSYVENNDDKRLVKDICIRDECFSGKNSFLLPDLIVKWSDTPVSEIKTVESNLYGSLKWKTESHSPDGRSGNHNNNGFMIVNGNIELNDFKENYSILDIAPTIYSLFNLDIPSDIRKNPIFKPQEC